MHKTTVFMTPVNESDPSERVCAKLRRLLEVSNVLAAVRPDDEVAAKIHFGEEGNTGHVRPEYAAVVCRAVLDRGARCFLSDTNTLYRGRRMQSRDHLALAAEHGFTPEAVGVPVVVPDELRPDDIAAVRVEGRFVKSAKIARIFRDADSLVGIAHFKGHMMTGFGGALKNIGMGCAAREGKLAQHSDISPVVIREKCVGCLACVRVCPADTIRMVDSRASIDPSGCVGCASCIASCAQNAIDVQWESGGSLIQEKMIEFAAAALSGKQGKTAFVNFITKVTAECDCLAQDDPRVVPDIGIVVSTDPVSIDKASYDLVTARAGRDIFRILHPARDGLKQLRYAQEMGLGTLDYELVEV